MLQINSLRTSVSPQDEVPGRPVTPAILGTVIQRYAVLVIVCTMVGAGLAVAYVTLSVPTYVAGAQLLIEPQRQQQLLIFEPGMLDLTLDNAQVESQVEVLRSERLAGAVVDALKLTRDPEFQSEPGLLPWTWAPRADETAPARTEAEKRRVAVAILMNRVGTRRIGQSYVLETTARSYHPERAAEIANAYMNAYLLDQYEAKAQMARGGVEWLQHRLRDVRLTLKDAAKAVEDFRTQNGLVATSNGLLNEQQLSEMNTQFIAARAQTAQAAARLARVRQVTSLASADASVTEALNNQAITNLRQRQQDAAQRESDLRARYGDGAEAVTSAHRDVVAAEAAIGAEVQRIAQIYLSEYEIARARERTLADAIQDLIGEADRLRQAKVTLSELDAQAQSYRKMYQNLLEKLAETMQKETLPVTSARVIAPASVPLSKNSPKSTLTVALGFAIGLLFGIGAGIVRHRLDRTVRSEADLRRAAPVAILGMLPYVPRRRWSRTGRGQGDPSCEVIEHPFSAFSLGLRGVKVALEVAQESRPIATLGIASLAQGDGKSCVALNLAALFAQANRRTLLVDADFRNPFLTRVLAPEASHGLFQALSNRHPALQPTGIANLSILPLSLEGPLAQSSDLMRSASMQALLDRLKTGFDLIVLDLSPMRETMDVRAAGRLLDGLLLVAAWGETETGLIGEAAAALEAAQANLVGTVLNKVRDPAILGRTI